MLVGLQGFHLVKIVSYVQEGKFPPQRSGYTMWTDEDCAKAFCSSDDVNAFSLVFFLSILAVKLSPEF